MLVINLLPWRQAARIKKRRRYILFAGVAMVVLLFGIGLFAVPWHRDVKSIVSTVSQKSNNDVDIQYQQILKHMKFVGYVREPRRTWGLLLMANGQTIDVHVGSAVGSDGVKVTNINDQQVVFILPNKHIFVLPLSIA